MTTNASRLLWKRSGNLLSYRFFWEEIQLHQLNDAFSQQQLPRSVPNRQEAVRVGNVTVLAQHGKEALEQRKQRFLARAYEVRETFHFVVCQQPSSHHIVVLHSLEQAEIDADLICFIENELSPFGFISTEAEFGATLFAVLASTFPAPRDQLTIWRRFCLNTLMKLRDHIAHPPATPPTISYVAPFATIYRRVFDLYTGHSFLDVGCSFGFLPVLLAERVHDACIMGCDNNPDALRFSLDLAATTGARQVMFSLQNILAPTILCLGTFDTVTALHLLEHISERDVPTALTHLLQLTSKRLLIAVPYEKEAQALYGHRCVFTPEKLHAWGKWCIEALGGVGQYQVEEVAGGMLIVDRLTKK